MNHAEFHWTRTIGCWVVAKERFAIWRPCAILNFQNFYIWSRDCHPIPNLLLCTKVHQNLFTRFNSIHAWDISTSVFEKQTFAKSRPNRDTRGGWWHTLHLPCGSSCGGTFGFVFLDVEGQCLSVRIPNFVDKTQSMAATQLFPVLKYIVRHTGNLFSVSISTISLNGRVILPDCQISSKSDHRCGNDVISIFKDGDRQPCWICFGVMANHQSVFLLAVFKYV